jgi:hypothetical protein
MQTVRHANQIASAWQSPKVKDVQDREAYQIKD